jgi:hypothetical protein
MKKGLAKAKRCAKLKRQGKVSAARKAGCLWPGALSGARRGRGRRRRGLAGHVRTCIQYKCVKGRGKKNENAACKTGYVLRCAVYEGEPGIPRTVATRKPYQEFTYGRYNRGSGARSIFPPAMGKGVKVPAALLKPMQKRMRNVPRAAVQPGNRR